MKLDGDLGDSLEQAVAVSLVVEMMLKIGVHLSPECLRRNPPNLLASDDGEPARGRVGIH